MSPHDLSGEIGRALNREGCRLGYRQNGRDLLKSWARAPLEAQDVECFES